jgi:hypothetical protein
MVLGSGGGPSRHWDGGEPGRDAVSQRVNGARGRQVEENAVLGLLDRGGHLQQREDHGRRLRSGQGRVGEGVGAERMLQDRGPARQKAPRGIGAEGRGRRAVAVEITLHRLASVFAIAAGAVHVFRHLLRGRRLSGRHDTPRVVTRRHDFGLDDDAPRLLP